MENCFDSNREMEMPTKVSWRKVLGLILLGSAAFYANYCSNNGNSETKTSKLENTAIEENLIISSNENYQTKNASYLENFDYNKS